MKTNLYWILILCLVFKGSGQTLLENTNVVSVSTTKLSKVETEKLIGELKLSLDDSLSKELEYNTYLLPDQRVLLELDEGEGIVYQSLEDIYSLINGLEESEEGVHLLSKTKFSIDKLTDSSWCIEKLSSILQIPASKLDFSILSIEEIDQLLNTEIEELEDVELEMSLIIYVGEIIRRKVNGQWFIKEVIEDDEIINEPWLSMNHFDYFQVFLPVIQELNKGENISLRAIVETFLEL